MSTTVDLLLDGKTIAANLPVPSSDNDVPASNPTQVRRGQVTALYGKWRVFTQDVTRLSLSANVVSEHTDYGVVHFEVHDHTDTDGGLVDIVHTVMCAHDRQDHIEKISGAYPCQNWIVVVNYGRD